MSQAFGGWVLDHHALAVWARVEPYAQSLVWSAMEVGMAVVVPVAALALACVARSARRRGWPVLTGSAAALRALDPDLGTDELP